MFEVCRRVVALGLLVWPLVVHAQSPSAGGDAVIVETENVVEMQARGAAWKRAQVGVPLAIGDRLRTGEFSRAAVRFTDLSMLRVDELTTIEISPPIAAGAKRSLDVKRGGVYFFSRDKAQEIEIRTPAANGALRGTEFELRVASNGRTRLTMFDGEVELGNAHGRVRIGSGEQATVEVGRAPRKTAVIEAVNIIQWCLYYPAVLDPDELGLAKIGSRAHEAYRAGDLLGALETGSAKGAMRTADERLFRASLILASGQVDKARVALKGVPTSDSRRAAIEQMIAAVKLQPWPRAGEPRTSSEWMAESYYRQSRSDLDGALRAARKATELSPNFGYAWARVAELEFSFGRTMKAMKVLEHALELSPRNAQAHALQGFLLAAQNRIGAARRSFDTAIELDSALGNAWLGRGLTLIRQNREEEGRHDLQTAAVLEPNRSILRSYLGKAFSQVGINEKANLEFERAKEIDPNDPTPWLYSAIQRKQENRYNEAIDDLEKSVELNDNRRIYRSGFLLDQDRAVRSTNLAAIYRNNGMTEQSVREGIRAVNRDYSSAGAHLFLSNSFNALRDPSRILLRYESAATNELLLSNLLSPVGGGSLSQFVSQHEYSKLFDRDGLGISTTADYFSNGSFRVIGSQFGTVGNISYALDAEQVEDRGTRRNNSIHRFEGTGTFKLQLGPQDSILLLATYEDASNGDLLQRYDPQEVDWIVGDVTGPGGTTTQRIANRTAQSYRFREKQDPGLLLAGWNHEWAPGNHTLLLLGRLANRQETTALDTTQTVLRREAALFLPPGLEAGITFGEIVRGPEFFRAMERFAGVGTLNTVNTGVFDSAYQASFETYSAELQQILTFGPTTILLGARYQSGEFETRTTLSNFSPDFGRLPQSVDSAPFATPPSQQEYTVDFERISGYLYDIWHVAPWLSLTGGVAYDKLQYPDNFRNAPINGREDEKERVSPKAGINLEPWRGAVVRGAYTQALGGASFDESIRLEPTQVAGFVQSFRTLASESILGSVAASTYELYGVSLEQKLPTRTYLGVEYNHRDQALDRTLGVFDGIQSNGTLIANIPSSIVEKVHYREETLAASINQMIGDRWSLGVRYRYTHSRLNLKVPEFEKALSLVQLDASVNDLAKNAERRSEAGLHEVNLYVIYNHPTGLFLRAGADWYQQNNDEFVTSAVLSERGADGRAHPIKTTQNKGLPGDDFWQLSLVGGYRFYRNQCELSCGVLNLTGRDYRLNPLSPYADLPRDATFIVRCTLSF